MSETADKVMLMKKLDRCRAIEENPYFDCFGINCENCLYGGAGEKKVSVSEIDQNFDGLVNVKQIVDALRDLYPHGHEEFIPLTIQEMELHSQKNYDYAGGGKATGNFDRVGTIVGLYPGIDWSQPENVAVFYALKQLDALLFLTSQGRDGKVEGKAARAGDISIYMKIYRLIAKDKENGTR